MMAIDSVKKYSPANDAIQLSFFPANSSSY